MEGVIEADLEEAAANAAQIMYGERSTSLRALFFTLLSVDLVQTGKKTRLKAKRDDFHWKWHASEDTSRNTSCSFVKKKGRML